MIFNVAVKKTGGSSYPTWGSGTDAEIAAVIAAAWAGELELSDVWSVGDVRTVSVGAISKTTSFGDFRRDTSAQDVRFQILDFTCTGFMTTNGRPKAIIGMKNCFSEDGALFVSGSSITQSNWETSARREWCNNGFKNALPQTFAALFKQFTWQPSGTDVQDYFALQLPSAVVQKSPDLRWQQYINQVGIKTSGINGSPVEYWTCTCGSAVGTYLNLYSKTSKMKEYTQECITEHGIAPFGCI